ncbi:MAG: Crp/Fnr family transcriptional regulator [Shimia sp.]|uniref:Crp/Fnr family transcriptional regulator n=1 Tax=Shimia sp. TaxID=1954381 RepID=UPI004059C355
MRKRPAPIQSLWQKISPRSVPILSRGFSRRDFVEGEAMYIHGVEGRGIYCLSTGLIALRTHHIDGNPTLLRLVHPGEIIGFRVFLAERPHPTESVALLPSRVCMVALRDANQWTSDNRVGLSDLAT